MRGKSRERRLHVLTLFASVTRGGRLKCQKGQSDMHGTRATISRVASRPLDSLMFNIRFQIPNSDFQFPISDSKLRFSYFCFQFPLSRASERGGGTSPAHREASSLLASNRRHRRRRRRRHRRRCRLCRAVRRVLEVDRAAHQYRSSAKGPLAPRPLHQAPFPLLRLARLRPTPSRILQGS